jgi:hypothetical protein
MSSKKRDVNPNSENFLLFTEKNAAHPRSGGWRTAADNSLEMDYGFYSEASL